MSIKPGMRFSNYVGQKIGKLSIVEKALKNPSRKDNHVFWRCLCDCGKEKIVSSNYLSYKHGSKIKSCGCEAMISRRISRVGKVRDLATQKFGRLLVLKQAERPVNTKSRDAFWLCQCDCGKQKVVRSACLTFHGTESCGCL